MIRGIQIKALFWLAVSTWILALLFSREPVTVALLRPSGLVLGVVIATTSLFERLVWRWKLLHPWFVSTPDMTGTYEGTIDSNWISPDSDEIRESIRAFISVHQTLSGVSMRLLTKESKSISLCSVLVPSVDGGWELIATYRNEPRILLQNKSRIHHGGVRLDIQGDKSSQLSGAYWTDRGTVGELNFKRVSRKIASTVRDAEAIEAQMGQTSLA